MSLSHGQKSNHVAELDAVVIGAGFSGLYTLHRLREMGYKTRVIEAGNGVGGTWYWNRYPGARCDIESIYYNYTFSDEILNEWTWSSRYAPQPEILQYANFVADKLDLRRDIQFNTKVVSAHYNEDHNRWDIETDDGVKLSAKHLIAAVGCLSVSNVPNFKGIENFEGEWYHTGRWPHEEVSFKGKRVGVIGTGSSGIQAIPVIAEEAEHLTVFQRTPQYSIPARNEALDPEYVKQIRANYSEIRKKMRESAHGVPFGPRERSALDDPPEVRQKLFEEAWEKGGLFSLSYNYNDLGLNEEANKTAADFVRSKIREIVKDPETADKLMPTYYIGTKRQIIDTNYYETYNRDNVSLIDIKKAPIEEITAKGIRTADKEYELDAIVFATGFDAMTGPLFKIDLRGRGGVSLKEKWAGGANLRTYLGISTAGFPNFFMITGPESPSVLSNMMVSIEQHVEWITDCIDYLHKNNQASIEANPDAEATWSKHVRDVAEVTLAVKTDSWYMGANIEGKPRGFMAYLGGVGTYRQKCTEVQEKGYEGFTLLSTSNTAK
ncbi:flavin-containing monooxygenase [Bacillus dakarensis]|uniref:flavin-containing monooxygenase n=1 Tax=Robertmurraya dakarensis TaxID=1926278 RepID=UPI0009820E31|nr:NAD(P)/FAD-dependent oxidoreductase [Bacillus dakarensis]